MDNNNNIRAACVNTGVTVDDPTFILREIFNDFDRNLYQDYRKKLETLIPVFNSDRFQQKINDHIRNLANNPSLSNLPEFINKLESDTMHSLRTNSLFDGVCTMKTHLDLFVSQSTQTVRHFNLFHLLNTLAAEKFCEHFGDDHMSMDAKADKLYSIVIEMQNNTEIRENGECVRNAFNENVEQRRRELMNKFVSKLVIAFKPIEIKLKLVKVFASFLENSNLVANGRLQYGWYQKVERGFVSYLTSSNNESDKINFRKLIQEENLENDRSIFIEFFENFLNFCKKNSNIIFTVSSSANNIYMKHLRVRKFHPDGVLLMLDSSWALTKAIIFKDPELAAQHTELERDLERISSTLDSNEYMPLIWASYQKQTTTIDQDDENVIIRLKGSASYIDQFNKYASLLSIYNIIQNIKNPDSIRNMLCLDGIRVKRTSLNHLLDVLTFVSDFKFKALLIQDCKIAIDHQVLYPAFNRSYGKLELPSNHGFDLSSFTPTQFSMLWRGDHPYYCPNGWLRYSIKVSKSSEEFESKYSKWPVAYHGTSSLTLINILKTGFRVSVGQGNASHGKGAYFSPSIEYSAHPRYSRIIKITNRFQKQFYIQTIFQCRLNPQSFYVKQETLLTNNSIKIDPNFDNKVVEWVISSEANEELVEKNEEVLVIYGIMVRISEKHPNDLASSHWWKYTYYKPENS